MTIDKQGNQLGQEVTSQLQKETEFRGEISFDLPTRLLYSTDASIYQIQPLGVIFPRSVIDLSIILSVAEKLRLPVLPRGAGSSLAGQAIGHALILDCSRYLNHIIAVDHESRTALVEPGVILAALNRRAGKYGLQFGPDPASAERATIGGCIANNATGSHSIQYGMTVDHIETLDVVLSDGTMVKLTNQSLLLADNITHGQGILANLYRTALHIRTEYADEIYSTWPQTWRRVSGYNLNYLLPWSPTQPAQWALSSQDWRPLDGESLPYPPIPKGEINLAALIAGSEGTLGVISRAVLRLVPSPRHTVLGVLSFPSVADACDATPELLSGLPSAVELIPYTLVHLARAVPAYASQLSFIDHLLIDDPEKGALLVIEFAGDNIDVLKQQVLRLGKGVWLAESQEAQRKVWAVRKVGLGILMSRLGGQKPTAFIEDIAVPVERLGEFIRSVEKILSGFGVTAEVYAHASAGCLHVRPILNLKTSQGVRDLRQIASRVVELALSLNGSVTGEHGDGLARSEWIAQAYGPRIVQAFRELKQAADPLGILNPGKIIDPAPMDTHLRYGTEYHAAVWEPVFRNSSEGDARQELLDAIEHCNGAGVCRKADGVMCPSFQASQQEMHSTRGRANLLRAMVSGQFPTQSSAENAVREALDLCLACKGCVSECPSGVDLARLKYEYLHRYYSTRGNRRPWRDYLFGYIDRLARLGQPFARLANPLMASRIGHFLLNRVFAISSQRSLPAFAQKSLRAQCKRLPAQEHFKERVLFLSDAFTEYFHPAAGIAAVRVLQAAGCQVIHLPVLGAGRTLISKGFLEVARRHAQELLDAIQDADPGQCLPIIGVEPSEIYTLRDEFQHFFPGEPKVAKLKERAWMVDEFLLRPDVSGESRLSNITLGNYPRSGVVLLHGHCYQKAQPPAADGYPVGVPASRAILTGAGYEVKVIDSGCCGMAGSFGYEKEHSHFSIQVGELALLPAVRAAPAEAHISAAGVSCQSQILDGSKRHARHPIEFLADCLPSDKASEKY